MGPINVPDHFTARFARLDNTLNRILGKFPYILKWCTVFAKLVDQKGHVGDRHWKCIARRRDDRLDAHRRFLSKVRQVIDLSLLKEDLAPPSDRTPPARDPTERVSSPYANYI